jgi:hypothetical protein
MATFHVGCLVSLLVVAGWLGRFPFIWPPKIQEQHGPEKNVYKLKNARCGGADAVVVASTSILIIALYWRTGKGRPLMAQKWRAFGALLRLSLSLSLSLLLATCSI